MTIIRQLIEFIFYRRQVKDIDYNPTFAALAIVADAIPLIALTLMVNEQGLELEQITINHLPVGLGVVYAVIFTALFYSFYAAQEKQTRFIQAATAFFGASFILTMLNVVISPLPGAGIIALLILGLKISCAVRVVTESLEYGVVRTVFSLIGIALMSMLIATMIFPAEITQNALITK